MVPRGCGPVRPPPRPPATRLARLASLAPPYLARSRARARCLLARLRPSCPPPPLGLVGITSACSVVEPWAAVVIGAIAAIFYTAGAKICIRFQIDDPVNASAVHFFAGAWGLLAPAFFAKESNMVAAYEIAGQEGLLYSGKFNMLATQAYGLGAVVAWVVANMTPFFVMLKCMGIFRVSADVEELGMDASEHGGGAYHMGK